MQITVTLDDVKTTTSAKTKANSFVMVLKFGTDDNPQVGLVQIASATAPTAAVGSTIGTLTIEGA